MIPDNPYPELDPMGELAYDPATETHLLSAILIDPSKYWPVKQIVTPGDFMDPRHQIIFETMGEVAEAGRLTGLVEVSDALVSRGRTQRVPLDYLAGLLPLVHSPAQAPFYAETVRKQGERRGLVEVAARVSEMARLGDDTGGDMIERAGVWIDELRAQTRRVSRPIGEVFDSLVEDMSTEAPFTTTPWYDLNSLIGGIRPGALVVVGARPANGKTVVGLQLAHHVARSGGLSGYVSLEMSEKELAKRLIALTQSVHQSGLQNHSLTESGWRAVHAAGREIKQLPLHVYDRGGTTFADIVAFARALAREGDLKVLVVDYFGLIASDNKGKKRNEELEEIAGKFKQLARDLDITVVVLSQLSRPDSGRGKTPRPALTDLRGTGALEQDADVVILLHRKPILHGGKEYPSNQIEMIVPKNRQGIPGQADFTFEGEYARITQKTIESTPLIDEREMP